MKNQIITQAIGNFLMNYTTDLEYIAQFQEWKKGGYINKDYLSVNQKFGLYAFLQEFKVLRGFNKDNRVKLCKSIQQLLKSNTHINVDDLSRKINKGSCLQSMASKIAMLYDPEIYLPIDRFARIACFETDKRCSYKDFNIKAKEMHKYELNGIVKDIDNIVQPLIKPIESTIKLKDINIKLVRENRILDKVLWTKGKFKI